MRIPTNSNTTQMLEQIQKLSSRQSKLQTQVATGQRIFQPEDDPAAVGRVLTFSAERRQIEQFSNNASYALDVSQASFSGINEIKKLSDRAGEIATLGAGDLSPSASQAYASELNQLIEQGVQLANTRLGNDYLYAGTAIDTPPFVVTGRDANGQITGINYVGNSNQAAVQISETASIAPGTPGTTNLELRDFLNHLVALRDALTNNDPAGVAAARPLLEGDENNLVSALSEHGAVQLRIEISQTQGQERLVNLQKLTSGEVDVDLADAATQLSQASIAYQAALQSASQIMRISLLDYLR